MDGNSFRYVTLPYLTVTLPLPYRYLTVTLPLPYRYLTVTLPLLYRYLTVVAQSRAWVNFEQQILALLLVFCQIHNLSSNEFDVMLPSWIRTKQINQSACCISSTCNKRFCCGISWSCKVKNEKHRPKTWNETILREKFRVFVSRISPPLPFWQSESQGSTRFLFNLILHLFHFQVVFVVVEFETVHNLKFRQQAQSAVKAVYFRYVASILSECLERGF